MKHIFTLAALACCAGCSTILEGTSQQVTVNTNPAGASCNFVREGISIARVEITPGAATIKKTKNDITVVCDKPGYLQATYINHSGTAGATFGNIVAGGLIGWGVDSASGADNKYDTDVNISLVPATGTAATPAPQPAPSHVMPMPMT